MFRSLAFPGKVFVLPHRAFVVATAILVVAPLARAGDDRPGARVRIHNLKILSNQMDDVTTPEAILKSFVKPGMKHADRAKALWTAAVKYRHQTSPPNEHLAGDWEAHDPVKIFNVYGYCMCCCSSALIESLNRLDGRPARGRILNGHSVPEVFYDGGWHMYDASLLAFFPKSDQGSAASVDEISQAVKAWYGKNPGYQGNGAKLDQLMRGEDWMGWKNHGPDLLAHCPYYHLGWLPARTHGWNATMVEYNRQSEIYEYGYHVGHRALMSLRPGEAFVREAGNLGLHVNMDEAPGWDALKARAPENDLVYVKEFFPGYRGSVVGNGYHRYAPDLAGGGLAAGSEVYDNLTTGTAPALRVKEADRPGVAIVPMTSPYVYLGGRLKVKALSSSRDDKVTISISTNNGRTFTLLWAAEKTGTHDAVVDLKARIFRRYAYWLKIEIVSVAPASTGLEALSVENDFQHAPRTLPFLVKGSNTITVAADGAVGLASRTFTGRITPDARFSKNETSASLGIAFDNLKVDDGSCWWKGGTGTMTVSIETPGALRSLRFCTQIRARGEKDLVRMVVSFDEGKTWQEAARMAGPTPGHTQNFRFDRIPEGVNKALFRYELTGNNTVGIFSFRIDADYRDPQAGEKFWPFQVVHRWKENGQEKSKQALVNRLPMTYTIETAADPEMVSVICAMPPETR